MATTPVQFACPSGLALTLELYPYGSDAIANGAGGDPAAEKTNCKGLYSADVSEAISGWHDARIKDGSGATVAVYSVYLRDTTAVHRCEDALAILYDGTAGVASAVTIGTNNDKTGYGLADGALTSAKFGANSIDSSALAASAVAEIQAGLSTYNGLDTSGVTTLLSRITGAIAPQTGDSYARLGAPVGASLSADIATRASSTEVTSIQNNTRAVRVVPTAFERPDSGGTVYRIELLLYDEVGNMEAPDFAPTISVVNEGGTSRDANLDSTTMSPVSTGRYRSTYTINSSHAIEQLLFAFGVVEGGATRVYENTGQVVDTTAVDFTAADRAKLDTLHDTRLTATRAANLDALNGHVAQTGDGYPILASGAHGNAALKTLIDAKPTAAQVATQVDADLTRTGFKLASDGLDSISPAAPAGVAANFREMVVQVWRRFFRKSALTATQLQTFADDGVTVVTQQSVADDGTTQIQGPAV